MWVGPKSSGGDLKITWDEKYFFLEGMVTVYSLVSLTHFWGWCGLAHLCIRASSYTAAEHQPFPYIKGLHVTGSLRPYPGDPSACA